MRIHRDINKLYNNRLPEPSVCEELKDLEMKTQSNYSDFLSTPIIKILTHPTTRMK